jgi:serine/threonine-protein kinase RsbW
MTYPQVEQVELFLPSTPGYEKVARNAAQAVAEKMGFSSDRTEDVMTAVAEACLNAMEHGNHFDQRASVAILLTVSSAELEVRVADHGFTQLSNELPTAGRMDDEGYVRGLGMYFISELVDELEVSQLPEGGNQVRMVIHLLPSAND